MEERKGYFKELLNENKDENKQQRHVNEKDNINT